MQPLSGNQRSDILSHISDGDASHKFDPLQILFQRPSPAAVSETATKASRFGSLFVQGAQSNSPAAKSRAWTSKSGTTM